MTSPPVHEAVHFSQAMIFAPILTYLENRGIATEQHLAQAGISPLLLTDQATPIPRKLVFRFIDEVCHAEAIEDIGLLAGQ